MNSSEDEPNDVTSSNSLNSIYLTLTRPERRNHRKPYTIICPLQERQTAVASSLQQKQDI